jgi:hypothetical protein
VVEVVLALWLVTGRLILLELVMAGTVLQVQLLALLLCMLAAVLGLGKLVITAQGVVGILMLLVEQTLVVVVVEIVQPQVVQVL